MNAAISLHNSGFNQLSFNFAGSFSNEYFKEQFLRIIEGLSYIKYLGIISGNVKYNLLMKSQIFCLPSYYPYEGQPISILEGYAAGCFVLTTDQGGIKDIFKDKINGVLIKKKSISSIEKAVKSYLMLNESERYRIGLRNKLIVKEKYTINNFISNIKKVFDSI